MNIKPARRRVTRDFNLWDAPFDALPCEDDERSKTLFDAIISALIIVVVCLGLLTYCTPAPAAGFDQYEADRRADARQEEADRRADERMRQAEAAADLREFQRRMDADNRDYIRRLEAVGTERDPYHHRRRY